MGKSFTRALRHLKTNHKTTKLDEKKEMLNEIPTMHTGGVYSKNPPGFRYDPPSPAKRFIPDVDGNWPAGVPGTPGATEYIRPQGYWVNDSDWETKFAPNMSNDSILESPTNTDGFIDAQSGTVKTLLPPNSRSFILGPLVDGYNYNHGYDDYTTIGYIQKDTRQFVLLGTIDGHWDTNVTESGFTPRLWDGTTFTAYNPSFTLAMAQWFKDRITANDYTKNFPYFYSGGVAQSPLNNQPPGSPGGMIGGNAAGTGGGGKEPSDGDGKAAVGSGGTPDIGTETPQGDPEGGDAASQGYPAWGRSGSKNKRGSGARGNRGRKKPKPSTPKPQGGSGGGTGNPTNRRGSGARNRGRGSGSGGSGGSTGAQGGSGGGQGNRTNQRGSGQRNRGSGQGNTGSGSTPKPQGGSGGGTGNPTNQRGSGQRNRGSGSTPKPTPTPKPTSTPKYQQNRNRQNRIRQDQQARNRQSNLNSAKQSLQLGVNIARGITDKVKYAGDYMFKGLPKSVKEYLPDFKGGGPKWAGGKKITDLPILKQLLGRDVQYFTPDLDTSIKYAGKNGKVVVVPRTPGVRGWKNWLGSNVSRGFDPTKGVEQIVKTSDTIAAKNLTKVIDLSKPGARETLQNLAKKGATTNKALSKLGKAIPFLNAGLVTADVTNRVRNGDYAGALLGAMQIIPGPIGWIGLASQVAYDVTGGNSPGRIPWNRQVSESVEDDINDDRDLGKALIELGLPDNKEDFVKEIGFYYSLSEDINPQLLAMVIMAISGEEMSKEQKEWIEDNIPNLTQGLGDRITKLRDGEDVQEGYSTLLEDKKRILREITQPLKEIKELPKTQKLEKYRPNFAGKYKPQNTPNVTASKQSDEMVKAKNAAGQTWRTKDKYWGGYESQERMNVVYDNVGHGNQYFDRIVNENLSKKNIKNRQVQEHLNIIAHEKAMRQLDSSFVSPFRNIEEQETLDASKDPLYKKVSKRLNKEIDYPDKPAKKGYPNEAPPEMVNGFHPDYGKSYKYDKLDPQSAEAMPVQGNPEIDANVQKALDKRAKNRKIKNLKIDAPTVENFNWKETLKEKKLEESKKGFKKFKQDLKEGMTTGSIMTLSTPPQGDGTVAIDSVDPLDNTSYAVVTDLFSVGDNLAANTGTTIRSSGSGSGTDGGFNVGGDYLAFQGVGTNDASNTRWAALSPMDSSAVDTITITAIVGNDTNGGEDPDAAGEGLVVMYKKPGMAQARFLNTDPQGVQRGTATSDIIIPLGSSSNSGLNSYSVEVPEYARAKDTQFVLIQPTNSGSEYDHYGITEIKVQRRAPVNVVVPLSDPAAISFINVGTTEGDPKKRKKKVQDQLDASDEYVTSQFGDDFPTGARLTSDDEIEASPIGINQVRDRFSPSKGEDSSTYVRGASTAQPDPVEPSSQTTMKPKDENGEEIKVKPVGRIAVQGADAADVDAQEPEPTEPEPTEPEPIEPEPEEPEENPFDDEENLPDLSDEEIEQRTQSWLNKKLGIALDLAADAPIEVGLAAIEFISNLGPLVYQLRSFLSKITGGRLGDGGWKDRLLIKLGIPNPLQPADDVLKDEKFQKLVNGIKIFKSNLTGRITTHNYTSGQISNLAKNLTVRTFSGTDYYQRTSDPQSPSQAGINGAIYGISDTRHEYVDDNIYVKDGKVYDNTTEKIPSLANMMTGAQSIDGIGKGYGQMIIPKDGSEPYFHFYDYNYNNLNSVDPEEVPPDLQQLGANAASFLRTIMPGRLFTDLRNEASGNINTFLDNLKDRVGLDGWPPGIHGATLTDFKIPLNKLPKETQEMIAAHPLSWTPERVANMSQEEINEQMSTVFKTDADYEDYFEYTQDITRMTTEPVNTVPYAVAMQEYIKLADQYENVQLEKYGEGGWEKFSEGLASENPSEFFASERASREDRDTILSLIEQINEKEKSATSDENLMKEIPDPEGERPEFDWDSDPDVVKYDNLSKESYDKYMNYYDGEYLSAWDAYESYAKSNLTLKDGYWRGPESKIARLRELAEEVGVAQKELNRLSAEYDKNEDLSTKANTAYLEKYLKEVKPWEDAQDKRNERRSEISNQYTRFVNELREINKPIWDYNSAQTFRTISGKDRYGDARWKVGGASWTASPEVAGGSYTSLKFSSIEKIVNEVFSDDKSRIKELRSKLNGTVYRGKNYYFDEYYNAEDEFIDEANALYEPVEHLQKYVDGNYVREVKIKEFGENYKTISGESWTPEKKGSGRRSRPRSPDPGQDYGSAGGFFGGDATAAATAAADRRRRNNNKNESTLYKKVIGKTLLKT